MKPYKLKHVPTGLYYQPKKSGGSNFSKRGKIYQTKTNILSMAYYADGGKRDVLPIYTDKNTLIFKEFKDVLIWKESRYDEYVTITNSDDWIIEEI